MCTGLQGFAVQSSYKLNLPPHLIIHASNIKMTETIGQGMLIAIINFCTKMTFVSHFRGIWCGLQGISFEGWRQNNHCSCGNKKPKKCSLVVICYVIPSVLLGFPYRILRQWYSEGYAEGMFQNEQVRSPKCSHAERHLLGWRASPFHHYVLHDKRQSTSLPQEEQSNTGHQVW